jgi:hypothetical protein
MPWQWQRKEGLHRPCGAKGCRDQEAHLTNRILKFLARSFGLDTVLKYFMTQFFGSLLWHMGVTSLTITMGPQLSRHWGPTPFMYSTTLPCYNSVYMPLKDSQGSVNYGKAASEWVKSSCMFITGGGHCESTRIWQADNAYGKIIQSILKFTCGPIYWAVSRESDFSPAACNYTKLYIKLSRCNSTDYQTFCMTLLQLCWKWV